MLVRSEHLLVELYGERLTYDTNDHGYKVPSGLALAYRLSSNLWGIGCRAGLERLVRLLDRVGETELRALHTLRHLSSVKQALAYLDALERAHGLPRDFNPEIRALEEATKDHREPGW